MPYSTQNPVGTVETICCTRRMEKVTVSHMFEIMGYSLDKDIGKGNFIESTIFDVSGYDWSIKYYPNGCNQAVVDDISIYLHLKSISEGVQIQVMFTIPDRSGRSLPLNKTTEIRTFGTSVREWGFKSFAKRAELESKIKDDCFVIKSVVTVFKVFPVEPTAPIVVPPGNIQQQLSHLLENGNGADVTFEIDGQTISAHKCILAARSPVFLAQFFGLMKEKSDTTIKIKEMEAPVFKAMLHFIYNDSFPGFEETKESDEKHDNKLMAQHLLVASDRYGLERLKIICENMLCGSINPSNVLSMLCLAERHSCNHLKAACLKFIVSPVILEGVPATEQYQFFNWNSSINPKEQPSVKRQCFPFFKF